MLKDLWVEFGKFLWFYFWLTLVLFGLKKLIILIKRNLKKDGNDSING